MKAERSTPKDIDEYIAGFPPEAQKILKRVRSTIRKAIPGSEEKISYQIPTFALNGAVIYFAGFKHHVGVYPRPKVTGKLEQTLAKYEEGRGTYRFPLDEPIPYDLIAEIAKLRLKEHLALAAIKAAKKAEKRRPKAAKRSGSRTRSPKRG